MLSAIVLTHNSASTITACLKSLSFCDEVILIDDHSSDDILEKISQFKVTVIQHDLDNDFAQQRDFAQEKAKGEWILFIDSDEEVTGALKKEITTFINSPTSKKVASVRIPRVDLFWNREVKHGEVSNAFKQGIIRLAKKDSGAWEGKVHEEYKTSGKVIKFNNYIIHRPHPSVKEFITDINKYSTIRAKELHQKNVAVSIWHIIAYPLGKFLYTYLLKRGFTEGPAGFVYSFLMSFHSFLVRSKLYQLNNQRR